LDSALRDPKFNKLADSLVDGMKTGDNPLKGPFGLNGPQMPMMSKKQLLWLVGKLSADRRNGATQAHIRINPLERAQLGSIRFAFQRFGRLPRWNRRVAGNLFGKLMIAFADNA